MQLFTRTATMRGAPTDVMPLVLEITEYVNEHSEMDVSLWSPMFGAPLGTFVWSARIDSLTELEANFDHLQADVGYLALLARAQEFSGPAAPEDMLRRGIHITSADRQTSAIGSYAEITSAVPAEGKLLAAMAFGMEIADLHTSITDASVMFLNDAWGDFGRLTWMSGHQSASDVDAAAEALGKDPEYIAKLDEAGDMFTPGSATRALARRIA